MGGSKRIEELLYSEEHYADPYPLWERMRHEAPVFFDEKLNAWLLTRYEDCVEAFANHNDFSNQLYSKTLGVVFGPTMLDKDGHEHVVQRRIVAPEFVGKRFEPYYEAIDRNARDLIKRFPDYGVIDLVNAFTTRLPVNVIVDMLGMDQSDHDRFHEWYTTMMAGLSVKDLLENEFSSDKQNLGVLAHQELAEYVEPIIEDRKSCPVDDLISKIVHAEAEGQKLTLTEIQAFISLLLVAGGETTDKGIANMWTQLLLNPDQLGEVLENHELFDAAFSEMMRHSPPVPGQLRYSLNEVTFSGVTIPPRAAVYIQLASANNDETVFKDPRSFKIDRDDLHLSKERKVGHHGEEGRYGHLGFGLGKHFCLGYEMARVEAVMGSVLLCEKMKNPRLAPGADTSFIMKSGTRSPTEVLIEYDQA
ncbi:MAG: cytochrome P450 [Actinomycetota bacterium]|nr:cytochrome P450 [Actinomycetota bacterium]